MKQPAPTFREALLGPVQTGTPPLTAGVGPASVFASEPYFSAAMAALGVVACMITVGCSGGSNAKGGTGGSSGGGGAAGTLEYKPCPQGTRVGGFSVQLIATEGAVQAYTSIAGGVQDAPDPRQGRVELAKDGPCTLTDAPMLTCTQDCAASNQICAGNNSCITEPSFQNVGTLTVTGLPAPVNVNPPATNQYFVSFTGIAYPPFANGAALKLSTSGGKYPAFMLLGQGITPLESSGGGLLVARNNALNVTWTPPPSAGGTRILMSMDIAHHGGGAARIDCDVPDTGSAKIPAGLIKELLDRGSAGFPQLLLTRLTADSVNIAPGCVDFLVSSSFKHALMVDGEVSCTCDNTDPSCGKGTDDVPCPTGQTCRQFPDPKALTCGP